MLVNSDDLIAVIGKELFLFKIKKEKRIKIKLADFIDYSCDNCSLYMINEALLCLFVKIN